MSSLCPTYLPALPPTGQKKANKCFGSFEWAVGVCENGIVQSVTPPSPHDNWDRLKHPHDPENWRSNARKWMDESMSNLTRIEFH